MYLYNCSNALDVVYKGAKPEFMEFGPYTYREWDSYTDVSWKDLSTEISGEELPAVFMNYTKGIDFTEAGDDFMDTKLVVTN